MFFPMDVFFPFLGWTPYIVCIGCCGGRRVRICNACGVWPPKMSKVDVRDGQFFMSCVKFCG